MFIKAQNNNLIVNMKNVSKINLTQKLQNGKVAIRVYVNEKHLGYIGDYKSEERAKEVLEEICQAYQKCCDYDYVTTRFPKQNVYIKPNFTFKMPEE